MTCFIIINQLVLWDPPVNYYSISRQQGSTSNPKHLVSWHQLSGTLSPVTKSSATITTFKARLKTEPLRATSSTLHHDRRHYLYSTIYIGYRSRVGYATNYAVWCSESTTTLLLRTYPNYVFPVAILAFDLPLGETTWFLEHIDT